MHSYCEADLCLSFSHICNIRFSHDKAHMKLWTKFKLIPIPRIVFLQKDTFVQKAQPNIEIRRTKISLQKLKISIPSDFISTILQPNTGCFPIPKRPVFSKFLF